MKKIFYALILFSIYGNAQNYMSRPNPIRQPIDQGGDLYLAQRVLMEKQRRYDVNWEKLKDSHIQNLRFLKTTASMNNIDFNRACDRYISEYWNKVTQGKYDISLNSTLESLTNYLVKGTAYIACVELKDCELYNNLR